MKVKVDDLFVWLVRKAMIEPEYDVFLECRTGTRTLHDGTSGAFWEDDYHIVRWGREKTQQSAADLCDTLKACTREVRRSWSVQVGE